MEQNRPFYDRLCRGKRYEDNVWVEGFYIETGTIGLYENKTDCWIIEYGVSEKKMFRNPLSCSHFVRPETIGRCTGVYDRKANRIYENDVIRVTTYDGIQGRKVALNTFYLVEWYAKGAVFRLRELFRDFRFDKEGQPVKGKNEECKGNVLDGIPWTDYHIMEVMGNIHDTPEWMDYRSESDE